MIELSYRGSPRGFMEFIGSEICEDCYGKGFVTFCERDRDGNLADTGMKDCHCQRSEESDNDEF